MIEYRAIFEYPEPWRGEGATGIDYGPARKTLEKAERDRPWNPEESHGRRIGIQTREVGEWQ